MRLSAHTAVSFCTGVVVWFFTKSIYTGIICFLFGIIEDIDHILDYLIQFGAKDFSIFKVYKTCKQAGRDESGIFKKLYLIFHMNEMVLLLWVVYIFTKNVYLLAATIGYSTHMIMDSFGNPMYPYTYFMTWRAIRRFNAEEFFRRRAS